MGKRDTYREHIDWADVERADAEQRHAQAMREGVECCGRSYGMGNHSADRPKMVRRCDYRSAVIDHVRRVTIGFAVSRSVESNGTQAGRPRGADIQIKNAAAI